MTRAKLTRASFGFRMKILLSKVALQCWGCNRLSRHPITNKINARMYGRVFGLVDKSKYLNRLVWTLYETAFRGSNNPSEMLTDCKLSGYVSKSHVSLPVFLPPSNYHWVLLQFLVAQNVRICKPSPIVFDESNHIIVVVLNWLTNEI